LDAKFGASVEDDGYMPAGLIAQDVQAKYPDAVIEDANGYLTIDLPVLADQDEVIAALVMRGAGATVRNNISRCDAMARNVILPHGHGPSTGTPSCCALAGLWHLHWMSGDCHK
jgi:hypothetical protein